MQNIEELMNQEYQARADLLEAQEIYKNESLAIRIKLGALFREKRLSIGITQEHTAALLGVSRQKVFSIESPDKVLSVLKPIAKCSIVLVNWLKLFPPCQKLEGVNRLSGKRPNKSKRPSAVFAGQPPVN